MTQRSKDFIASVRAINLLVMTDGSLIHFPLFGVWTITLEISREYKVVSLTFFSYPDQQEASILILKIVITSDETCANQVIHM